MTTYQATFSDTQDLKAVHNYPLSGSSVEIIATDMEEMLIRSFDNILKSHRQIEYIHPPFPGNFDTSSIVPNIEVGDETYITEGVTPRDMLEHGSDLVFRMPPKRSYKIRMKVGSVIKGRFRFVAPD